MNQSDLRPAKSFRSGIYKIIHVLTGKIYVGSAVDIKNRWRIHKDDLKYNRHGNKYLQGFYNNGGLETLIFEVIEFCDREKLLDREQYWMKTLNCIVPNGCNILSIAGSRLGAKHSEETKLKLKEARNKRGPTTEATKIKMSIARKGRYISPEHRRKLSEAHKGKPKIRKSSWQNVRLIECKPQI